MTRGHGWFAWPWGSAWRRRWRPLARAQTPTPTATLTGAPKFLLAFDASGSMLGPDYSVEKFPAPGNWYVSVGATDSDIFPAEIPAELPLEIEGSAQPSSANFAALPGTTATPRSTAEPSEPPLDGRADAGSPTLAIALVALLALGGGVGLGALASRLLVRP